MAMSVDQLEKKTKAKSGIMAICMGTAVLPALQHIIREEQGRFWAFVFRRPLANPVPSELRPQSREELGQLGAIGRTASHVLWAFRS